MFLLYQFLHQKVINFFKFLFTKKRTVNRHKTSAEFSKNAKGIRKKSEWEKCHFFIFQLKGKGHEPSRAKLKILQLELWLQPARLELITTTECLQLDNKFATKERKAHMKL